MHELQPGASAPTGKFLVATHRTHGDAENAVKALHRKGYDITKLSITYDGGRIESRIVGFSAQDDRIRSWYKGGALWAGILGTLMGVGFYNVSTVTTEFVIRWIAVVLAASLILGGLTAAGAFLRSELTAVDPPLEYELDEQDEEQFMLATSSESLAAQAQELLSHSDPIDARLKQGAMTYPTAIRRVSSGVARLWQERARTPFPRRKRSEGTKI